jgi:starch synthase
MTRMRVLSVASEIYPIIKTGGLADVAGALPIALKAKGIEVCTLVPGYPDVLRALDQAQEQLNPVSTFGGDGRLLRGKCGELDLFVLDVPHLYARGGNPYLSPEGTDWPDNGIRFAALARMAADIGFGVVPSFVPDIVHVHDWQAALAPAYLNYGHRPRPRTVITVHNLAFQGIFPHNMLEQIGLPSESFTVDGVEYYGAIGFLKAGLRFADMITTVSPTYALEIQSDEGGMGLGGLLRSRSSDLRGILNGVDTTVWDPATDAHIQCRYDASTLERRAVNKAALQKQFGLKQNPDALLLGVISRLSEQKGLDLLLECIPAILAEEAQLALLGSGDAELERRFRAAVATHAEAISVVVGFDEVLAHQIQAGADALVVPSRFEPCGLTQLCALRYGAVPLVARVGGLEDTVADVSDGNREITGFKFGPVTAQNLAAALYDVIAAYRDRLGWREMQLNGMSADVSWESRASEYSDLYHEVLRIIPGRDQ